MNFFTTNHLNKLYFYSKMAKRFLWADDNKTFRESMIVLLGRYCSRQGIDVEFDEASSGDELVEKVIGGSYDLVFTDNQMPPGMHGLLALRWAA